ncbi:MAG: globin [Alicyclobacillus sp.]|nr:globin [Alicyclobacillus sp.]
MNHTMTIYEAIGGAERIRALVTAFYLRVAKDPVLKPLFPEDLTETREKQYAFLTQFFGGPPLYLERYGHPMMRARHLRFRITPRHKEAWLACMASAMDEVGLEGPVRDFMFERLTLTAGHMVNTLENGEQEDLIEAEQGNDERQ